MITPGPKTHQIYQLDQDNDGVFDRENWTKWWVQRWKANPSAEGVGEGLGRGDISRGESTGQKDREGEEEGGEGAGERISELTERARQARRRAGTDIHTAAWTGDLELVKVWAGFVQGTHDNAFLPHKSDNISC